MCVFHASDVPRTDDDRHDSYINCHSDHCNERDNDVRHSDVRHNANADNAYVLHILSHSPTES